MFNQPNSSHEMVIFMMMADEDDDANDGEDRSLHLLNVEGRFDDNNIYSVCTGD